MFSQTCLDEILNYLTATEAPVLVAEFASAFGQAETDATLARMVDDGMVDLGRDEDGELTVTLAGE